MAKAKQLTVANPVVTETRGCNPLLLRRFTTITLLGDEPKK